MLIVPTMENSFIKEKHDQIINNLLESTGDLIRCCVSKISYEEHCKSIEYLKKRFQEITQKQLKVMLDIPCPKDKNRIIVNKDIEIYRGEKVYLSNMIEIFGDSEICIGTDASLEGVDKGDEIYIGNGNIRLKALENKGEYVECISLNYGIIKSGYAIAHKSGFFKETSESITKKCLELIKIFEPEYIVLSYIESINDIIAFKEKLSKVSNYVPNIMSKIECYQAILNMKEIVDNSDSIMIARGCLALNVGMENLLLYQDKIMEYCVEANVKCCIASNILKSLNEMTTPSRADICDLAHMIKSKIDFLIITDSISRTERYYYIQEFIDKVEKIYK